MKLTNTTLVLPHGVFQGSNLEVEAGCFSKLVLGRKVRGIPQGIIIIPGIIDLHGDMLEREIEPRPGSRFPTEMTIKELDKRHAAAGVTTAYVALSFANFVKKEEDDLELRTRDLVSAVCELKPKLGCDTRIHARFEVIYPEAKAMLKDLIAKGQVHMVSLMDHSPGQGQFRDLEDYVSYMANWLKVERWQAEAELKRQLARPKAWDSVRDIGELAQAHDLPIASHDDDSPAKVALMSDFNVNISEFPITLEGAEAAKQHKMWTLMGAPNALRGGSHSGNLSAIDVLKAGLLDTLASDYYPAAMLQAAVTLAQKQLLPFHEAIKLISLNPAHAANLTDRGSLTESLRADFVAIELNGSNSPTVIASFSQGKLIYWSGRYSGEIGICGL